MLKLTLFMSFTLAIAKMLYIFPPYPIILDFFLDCAYPTMVYVVFILSAIKFKNLTYCNLLFSSLISTTIGRLAYLAFASTDFVKPYGPNIEYTNEYLVLLLQGNTVDTIDYFLVFALLKFFYTHTQPQEVGPKSQAR